MDAPIVFVHLGSLPPPDYAALAVAQARRWNPSTRIVFLTDTMPAKLYGYNEEWIDLSTIEKTPVHERFCQQSVLDCNFREGFWRYTTERLYSLYDWMITADESAVFHLEYDNLLYTAISELSSHLFQEGKLFAPALTYTIDETRIGFGVCIVHAEPMLDFLTALAVPSPINEMERGGEYWRDNEDVCKYLPVCPKGSTLSDEAGRWALEGDEGVFDCAPYGQILGGIDPRNGPSVPGFVNPESTFRTDQFSYGWEVVDGRRRPFAELRGKRWPIYNLHVHCKNLEPFMS